MSLSKMSKIQQLAYYMLIWLYVIDKFVCLRQISHEVLREILEDAGYNAKELFDKAQRQDI